MIPSPNHSSRGGQKVRLLVIHTAEGSRTVESLGGYFASASSQVSSHVGIDDNRIEQYVDYAEEAWTALSASPISDQAELCGFAAWTRDNWLNDHHRMLELTAQWIAERCKARGIPLTKLSPAQLAAGQSGVIGHVDWTNGMKQGTHQDPGVGFPWDTVMGLAALAGQPAPVPQGMDAATLAAVMGNVAGVPYVQYLGPFLDGMTAAGCTTVNRAAMWCAQLGEESGGLRWMEEIADGSAYEGRKDLGNTQPGDGKRFKGRGPIQLTGRANYGAFSSWAHDHALVDTADYFVQNPLLVAQPRWGFLAASWYWTVARVRLNTYADTGDVRSATRAINGGTNGLADRTARWNRALTFGARLLPIEGDDMAAVPQGEWDEVHAAIKDYFINILPTWAGGTDEQLNGLGRSLRDNVETRQVWLAVQALTAKVDTLAATVAGLAARQAQP